MRKRHKNPIPWALQPWPLMAAVGTAIHLHMALIFHATGAPRGRLMGALMIAFAIVTLVVVFLNEEKS